MSPGVVALTCNANQYLGIRGRRIRSFPRGKVSYNEFEFNLDYMRPYLKIKQTKIMSQSLYNSVDESKLKL